MCLFKYREKRYGKFAFVLMALVMVALAGGAIYGGVYAVMHMTHWSRFVIVSLAGVVGLILGGLGIFFLIFSTSMINSWKSVRDGNKSKGLANGRLCDKCGRVISKVAEFCEHCGEKQDTGHGLKKCPKCKAKNSAAADFCEKCGHNFREIAEE